MTQDYADREQFARPESDPAASDARLRTAPVTQQEFCAGFDRCFGRVYVYVRRRVSDREACERIVSQVLTESLDLLVNRSGQRRELSRLKASSDRLIALEAASSASTRPAES